MRAFESFVILFAFVALSAIISCASSGRIETLSYSELAQGVFKPNGGSRSYAYAKNSDKSNPENSPQDGFLDSGSAPEISSPFIRTAFSSLQDFVTDDLGDNLQASASKDFKRIRFLFVPAAYSGFDTERLGLSIKSLADAFDVDLVVVIGDRAQILPLANGFDQKEYSSMMILRSGVVLSKLDCVSNASLELLEFEDFAVVLYQGGIDDSDDEDERFAFGLHRSSPDAIETIYGTLERMSDPERPTLMFASPFETSYRDYLANSVGSYQLSQDTGSGSFVKDMENIGFIDAYDACRYAAPAIGTAHPGFTYEDENGGFRIDFVMFRDMIPVEVETLYVSGLSDLEGVRRYAIIGELAI